MSAKHTVAAAEQVDRQITTKVNDKRDNRLMQAIGTASEIGDQPQMRVICAATIMLGVSRRDRRLAETGLRMLVAHTLATWCKSRIKAVVNRTRPESGDDPRVRPGDSDRHEDNSFPSGHSAGAVAVGEAFARTYPHHSVAARSAALSVSAIQVPRGTHYVGDVLAGIVIGVLAERVSDAAIVSAGRWARDHRAEFHATA